MREHACRTVDRTSSSSRWRRSGVPLVDDVFDADDVTAASVDVTGHDVRQWFDKVATISGVNDASLHRRQH